MSYGGSFPVQMRATPSVTATDKPSKNAQMEMRHANINNLSQYGHQYGLKKVEWIKCKKVETNWEFRTAKYAH